MGIAVKLTMFLPLRPLVCSCSVGVNRGPMFFGQPNPNPQPYFNDRIYPHLVYRIFLTLNYG